MKFNLPCVFAVLAATFVACNPSPAPHDGGDDADSSDSAGVGDGGPQVWSLRLNAVLAQGAGAYVGTRSVEDTGGARMQIDPLTSRSFHAEDSASGGSANSQLTMTVDDHQITVTGTVTTSSPGLPAATSAIGQIGDLGACVTAPPGVTRIRVTYQCSATPMIAGHSNAALDVTAGAINYCVIAHFEGSPPRDERGTLVHEYDYPGGTYCWSSEATIAFVAGSGDSAPGGTASVTGTVSIRFDPVY